MAIYVPPLTPDEIAQAAAKCLQDHHPDGSIPVPVEDIIDLGFKIDVVSATGLEERFGIDAFITGNLKEIHVEDMVYRTQSYRLRFSLAHELGHLILHPAIYRQLAFKTKEEWWAAMSELGKTKYDLLEGQAHAFGRRLVCPTNQLVGWFRKIEEALGAVGKTFKDAEDYAVKSLAKEFDVSRGTIWYRLRDENLI